MIEYVNTKGELVVNPAEELKKLLSPYLKNPKFFTDLSLYKKQSYLAELFGAEFGNTRKKIAELIDKKKHTSGYDEKNPWVWW